MSHLIKNSWYAGEQLEALKTFLDDDYKIIASHTDGGYQGDCYAVIKSQHVKFENVYLWRDSFGSCCGCDGLDNLDWKGAHEYIKATLQEGNTRTFDNLELAKKYLNETEDYWWKEFPKDLLTHLEKEITAIKEENQ